MNTNSDCSKNPRLLFWGRALVETKTLSAIIVLFYAHRGLQLEEVFYLSIVWSITSLLVEIPSGYLADRIGRKQTLLLGVSLLCTSHILTFFAYDFWTFAISFVLMSAAFSCFSGTEEALLYESLMQSGTAHQMNARNGKQLSARALPDMFIPAIGAFVAHDLVEWQFQVLIVLQILVTITAFLVLSRLTEPRRLRRVIEQERGIFRQSLKTITTEPWLLKVALNKILLFIAVFTAWRVSQPMLHQLGFGPEALGLFYVVLQTLEFSGGWFTGSIERRFGTTQVINMSATAGLLLFTVAILSDAPWIVFSALALGIPMNSLREPLFAHAIHARLSSESRATTLSNMNVVKGVLDIPILFLAGWFSRTSTDSPLLLAIGLCAVVILLLPIRARELQHINSTSAAA